LYLGNLGLSKVVRGRRCLKIVEIVKFGKEHAVDNGHPYRYCPAESVRKILPSTC
jgi:hypothetical protein